jgi:hypothetical protein
MDKTKFKYETIGTTTMFSDTPLEDAVYEEMGKRYTEALVESMRGTKDTIMAEILRGNVEKHQIEVNFDD